MSYLSFLAAAEQIICRTPPLAASGMLAYFKKYLMNRITLHFGVNNYNE